MEKGIATHSSSLAWRIQWTEELGGLQSMVREESDTTGQLTLSLFERMMKLELKSQMKNYQNERKI